MVTPSWLARLALCAICGVAGCGTAANLRGAAADSPTSRPYGGVQSDAEAALALLGDTSGGHGGLIGRALQFVIAPYLLAVDLPISAVGDTLTLPIVAARMREQRLGQLVTSPDQPPQPK
jgi:uncharacterized protein YceK